jgi:membrane-associated protease RseP (regulator of RpoE activity)
MTLTAKEPGTPEVVDTDSGDRLPPDGSDHGTQGNSGQILRLLVALALITGIFVVAGLGDLLIFIVIIVLIVMLHELAHFATAKWCGMKVTEYFVGFGPRLWSFRRGETEYGVKAIPAGGYVKITGFTMLEEVAVEDEPRTYRQQAFWKRIVVASAGSVMHFIIAFVLALIVAFSWGVPSNNESIQKFDHWVGVAHTPAQLAGLQPGDTIVSFNGHSFKSAASLQNDLKGTKAGQAVNLGIDRAGRLLHLSVTPRSGKGLRDSNGALQNRPYIGVSLAPTTTSVNPLQAIKTATFNIGSYTKLEVLGTGRLFSASGLSSFYDQVTNPKVAAKLAAHPTDKLNRPLSLVGIASLGVQDQQNGGLHQLLILLILINIIFGLLNMLPMIPLDGGHVAVAAYEWIRTKKGQAFYRADITKMFPVVAVFLAFLLVITLSAVYLDITHPLQIH